MVTVHLVFKYLMECYDIDFFLGCVFVSLCKSLVVTQPETASTVENQPVEDPPSSRFTWRIDSFFRLNAKKLYSDIFSVGGYKW